MANLSSAHFLRHWRQLYALSNPKFLHDRWTVEDMEWVRQRHAFHSDGISFQIEHHVMTRTAGRKLQWRLLVTTEQLFFGPKREPVRNTEAGKVLDGKSREIADWFREQAESGA
ncbi:hypothetical protein [Parvibaculum sp. MBR-TMA-1.3b-4.2]|jgi:hypothetical protein